MEQASGGLAVAATPDAAVARRLALHRGVVPMVTGLDKGIDPATELPALFSARRLQAATAPP